MNSWVVWVAFVVAVVFLGFIGYHFTVRTLRFVALALAVVVVIVVTRYGVTHPAVETNDLASAFTKGFDDLSRAFLRPALPAHDIPVPGRVGWIVLAMALIFAYRELEVWAMCWQPPTVDTSALDGDRQATQSAEPSIDAGKAVTFAQLHDRLIAELKFRLPAVEVRSPAILPGGTKPSGLASIVENSGVNGSGLAGAIIRFFGMLWPNPRRYQVRVWIEPGDGSAAAVEDGTVPTKVTVDLENSQTGVSIATQSLVASTFGHAAEVVAGYVAWSVFKDDRTTPPWCFGATDGEDLTAILAVRHQRDVASSPRDIQRARQAQIKILEGCRLRAGVARYELAQLYDLEGSHLRALRLHAANREDYPRFFRGQYRLAMSLEMIAQPAFSPSERQPESTLRDTLTILDRCQVTRGAAEGPCIADGKLPSDLRKKLLLAAQEELQQIRRQLTLPWLIWATVRHRDERSIWMPYWRGTQRQRFHDGALVAGLLVTTRDRLLDAEMGQGGPGRIDRNTRHALRIVDAVTGETSEIRRLLDMKPGDGPKDRPLDHDAGKTRWLPWQRRTPSWQAAYNAACLYGATYVHLENDCKRQQRVVDLTIASLRRAFLPRDSEMQRPSDWISTDPDFNDLKSSDEFSTFLVDQIKRDYPRRAVTA